MRPRRGTDRCKRNQLGALCAIPEFGFCIIKSRFKDVAPEINN